MFIFSPLRLSVQVVLRYAAFQIPPKSSNHPFLTRRGIESARFVATLSFRFLYVLAAVN